MANNIERLNYYDREYLRSFDLTAEQNYHLEMRRRLNLALHLWGIVEGLDVKKGEVVPGAPDQFYISPGMAIDAYGREIFLFAPFVLEEDVIQKNQITVPGRYSLFIGYATDLATPPSPGYRVCDLENQYTRRQEAYEIRILPSTLDSKYDKKATVPTATDELSDDPKKKEWLVRLGSVDVAADLTISNAWPKNRIYIGLRAQRIEAPVASLGDSAPDANRAISVEADLRPRKNLIIGKDFDVPIADVTPAPTLNPFPSKKGNVKVRHDLFMRGEFYKLVDSKWLAFKEYVRTLVPDIQVKTIPITILPDTLHNPSLGAAELTLTSSLPQVSSAAFSASIAGITWKTKTEVDAWHTNIAAGGAPVVSLTPGVPARQSDNSYKFTIHWSIGPNDLHLGAGNPLLPIDELSVSCVAVFYP